ncbi:hypothetical protein O3P69_019679 [Scylla paramamosain]|uniref:Uncharacterized protein n=1 Tax=Scylla paramamosain TaxID=85552 RepID=A0AAW0SWQ3_SCYPA
MFKLVVLALVLTYTQGATVYTIPGAPLHYPLTYGAPLTYAHTPLVAPAPYRITTGVKTDVKVLPVEQHGYVVKY